MFIRLIGTVCATLWLAGAVLAGDGTILRNAMEGLYDLPLDLPTTLDIQDLVISHEDMTLTIDSGRVAFFSPDTIDGLPCVCGAYIQGPMHFVFSPAPKWEKGQLQRFYSDSSVRFDSKEVALFFSDSIRAQIASSGKPPKVFFNEIDAKRAKKLVDRFQQYDGDREFRFQILQASMCPADRPFLLIAMDPSADDRIFYKFNPLDREEVQFYRNFRQPGTDFMELVCQYSQHTLNPEIGINGISKDRLQVSHYTIDGTITTGGTYVGSARMSIVADSSISAAAFLMHPELKVDSVLDASGLKLEFGRYKYDNGWHTPLYVFFDTTHPAGTTFDITAYYQGEIAKRVVGEFFVTASGYWMPVTDNGRQATYDMTFHTPKQFAFVSAGKKVDERTSGDTLITHWTISEPAIHTSFAIGNMKKFEFTDSLTCPVDVYYNEDLHRSLAQEYNRMMAAGASASADNDRPNDIPEIMASGKHMERQVGQDVINALRLFNYRFGKTDLDRLAISEIIAWYGQTFPGFIHLGLPTWQSTDEFGRDRFFRAHETAHLWWGMKVGWNTYHDQWLSEGFASYCALLYLQAVAGNDKFLDQLRDYRKEIIGAHHYPLGSGAESGPVILGQRTASTKTRGDYDLIVYEKGAFILHMLRNMMMDLRTFSDDRFFAMMKDYGDTYRGKQPSTADFRAIVEEHMGEDMGWFFDEWVYGTEVPRIDFTYTIEPGENNTFTAKCKMVTNDVPENFFTYIPVEIQIDDKTKAYIRIALDKPVTEFMLPKLPRKPKALKLNPFESVLADVNQ